MSLCEYQAIKSFHNYATPDRCIVQRETLKGLSVARGKKRLWRETEKREKDDEQMRDRESKKDREIEWINERRRARRERARINERADRKMKMGK